MMDGSRAHYADRHKATNISKYEFRSLHYQCDNMKM